MSPSNGPNGPAGTLLRVSIATLDRRLDIGVPASTPLAELMPGFARNLGELDANLVYGGYRLRRADGSTLRPDTSLLLQGVSDGELLTLVVGADDVAPKVYDDVVEAVGDAVESNHTPWTGQDSARTALAASASFLVASAILLLGATDSSFSILIAGIGAVLILAAAAVLDRLGQSSAGRVLALTASAFGAVAGYLAADHTGTPWGSPLMLSALGAAVAGLVGLFAIREQREICLVPITAGLFLAAAGAVVQFLDVDPSSALALAMAITVTVGNGIPWLAVSSSRIKVVSPLTDAEVFDDPGPIENDGVAQQYNSGRALMLTMRATVGIVALICTVPVAASGLPGALLCALAFLGMMVGTRQTFTRADVLTVMSTGVVGLLLTGLVSVSANPEWRSPIILILGATAALTVALALLSDKPHLGLSRIADGVDLFALALLLPLGVVVAGLV